MSSSTDFRTDEIRKFLTATLQQVSAIPLADYEDVSCDVTRELVPRIIAVTGVASEVLTIITERYEPEAGKGIATFDPRVGLLTEMDRRLDGLGSAREIADLAFMARMGLKWRMDRALASVEDADRWRIIGQCSSARREVIKSCTAVDVAICRSDGIESDNRIYLLSEIARSLEVRRQYILLRQSLLKDTDETPTGLLTRLRLTATSLTKLTSKPIYADLRVNDRQQMRSLQGRILEWLREYQGAPDRGARAAVRLVTDITGFAELLDAVNNRSELRDHDLGLVDEALAAMAGCCDGDTVAAPVLRKLELLLSRDSGVDKLLNASISLVGPWRAALQGVHQRLSGRTADVAVEGDFL